MKGYFLIVDLLGFSNIVVNLDPAELDNKINAWVSLVDDITRKYEISQYQLMSDTLFVCMGEDKSDLEKLIDFSAELLSYSIIRSLPLRGAISFGEYNWNEKLVYGEAVITAHQHEANQNWIGISLTPGITDVEQYWGKLVCYQIPLKSGELRFGAAIRWVVPTIDELASYISSAGLAKDGKNLPQKWREILEQTALYSIYVQLVEKRNQKFSEFQGVGTPVHLIEKTLLTRGSI